jgi:Carbohydrate binding domain
VTTPVVSTVRGRSDGPSPELVGGVVAAVVLVLVAVIIFGTGSRPSGATDPSPTTSPTSLATATATPLVDATVAQFLISINGPLIEAADRLEAELERDPFRPADVQDIIREINQRALIGADAVQNLGTTDVALDMIDRLGAVYASLREIATATQRASITNAPAYRNGAEQLIEALAPLPGLNAELEELRDGVAQATPTASSARPSPSDEASPVVTPSPAASPTPTASLSPSPSTTTTPGPVGPSQIVNGGFESGVGSPWALQLVIAADAKLVADLEIRAAGDSSARVDIVDATPAYAGVTLRQPGLRLEAGARYTVRVSLRATNLREIRVQLASRAGETYLTRVASAAPSWSVASFTFTAPVSDQDAVLEFGLGRTAVTTWLDEVSLSPAAPTDP